MTNIEKLHQTINSYENPRAMMAALYILLAPMRMQDTKEPKEQRNQRILKDLEEILNQ